MINKTVFLICLVFIVTSCKKDTESRNEYGHTQLHLAVAKNNIPEVNNLLTQGADVNAMSYDSGSSNFCPECGSTPLHVAAVNGFVEAGEILLANGAIVDSRDKDGITPLHMAVSKGHKDMVVLLLNKGADVNARHNFLGRTPLFWANDIDIAKILIANGAEINVVDVAGMIPLHMMAIGGNIRITEMLLANDANVNYESTMGTPTQLAEVNQRWVLMELLRYHSDQKYMIKNGWSNIFRANDNVLASENTIYHIEKAKDGGYIAAGSSATLENKKDFYILKLDIQGCKIWDQTYGGKYDDEAYDIKPTDDGGYIVTGYTIQSKEKDHISHDILVLKFDSKGKLIWKQIYGGMRNDEAYAVQTMGDGCHIVTGYSQEDSDGTNKIWLSKLNSQGQQIWDQTFGGSDYDRAYDVQITADAGCIIVGTTESKDKNNYDILVTKLDGQGRKMWTKTYGGNGHDRPYNIKTMSDGSYIVVGTTESKDKNNYDILVTKLDGQGRKMWTKTYEGIPNSIVNDILITSDDKYIATGTIGLEIAHIHDVTKGFPPEQYAWVLKLNKNTQPSTKDQRSPKVKP